MPRVLVVEDERKVLRGLQRGPEQEGQVARSEGGPIWRPLRVNGVEVQADEKRFKAGGIGHELALPGR
jgi:hypothetical protein